MGVDGLWELLAASATETRLEQLRGKRVAIDTSLWLVQFSMAMRQQDGSVVPNAHLKGMLQRICKLLYYGIKPVFVFDGPAPALKRKTLTKRQRQRLENESNLQRTAEKLLLAQLKLQGAKGVQKAAKKAVQQTAASIGPLQNRSVDVYADEDWEQEEEEEEINLDELDELDELDVKRVSALPISTQREIVERQRSGLRREWRQQYMEAANSNQLDAFSSIQIRNYLETSKFNQSLERERRNRANLFEAEDASQGTQVSSKRIASKAGSYFELHRNPEAIKKQRFAKEKEQKQIHDIPIQLPKGAVGYDSWMCIQCRSTNLSIANRCQHCSLSRSEAVVLKKEKKLKPASATSLSSMDISIDDLDALLNDSASQPALTDTTHRICPLCGRSVLAYLGSCSFCKSSLSADTLVHDSPTSTQPSAIPSSAHSPSTQARPTSKQRHPISSKSTKEEIDDTLEKRIGSEHSKTEAVPMQKAKEIDDGTIECELPSSALPLESTALENVQQMRNTRFNFYQLAKKHVLNSDLYADAAAQEQETGNTSMGGSATLWSEPTRAEESEPVLYERETDAVDVETQDDTPTATVDEPLEEEETKSDPVPRGEPPRALFDSEEVTEEMIAELERKKQDLERRQVETTSEEVLDEVHTLLSICGIPWVDAPTEAEAQCAYLNQSRQVDAVITNDSDVLLFGADEVYKNVFGSKVGVERFTMDNILSNLGLTRAYLIRIALLLGSDYTEGIKGIGIVNALEILNAFPEDDGLQRFRDYVYALGDGSEYPPDSFEYLHRNARRTWQVERHFPSIQVIEAYMNPVVDKTDEPFEWSDVNVRRLESFCYKKLGWKQEQVREKIDPVIHNQKRSHQNRITNFMSTVATIKSKRLRKAVHGLKKKT